ncbi:MAG: metalloregulator ArsR/SmtB family transcription factor [Actinomycetota bacterium]
MKELTLIEDCCPGLLVEPLDDDSARVLADAFKVLADPARLKLLSIIAAHPEHEACVCDVIEPLGLKQPTVSHHLKVLHAAGLLERERRGTWVYYRVVPGPLEALRSVLAVPVPA